MIKLRYYFIESTIIMDDSSQQLTIKAFKIILVGSQAVGKSSILCRLISSNFPSSYQATVGIDYHTLTKKIKNQNYNLQIWDTAGQQKFRALTSTYYKNCSGCFCVYDVTNLQSIESCEYFLGKATEENIPPQCTYLVGNKIDLLNEQQQNQSKKQDQQQQQEGKEDKEQDKQLNKSYIKEGQALAQRYGIKHFTVSAKAGIHINDTFSELANDLVQYFSEGITSSNIQLLPKLKITQRTQRCQC